MKKISDKSIFIIEQDTLLSNMIKSYFEKKDWKVLVRNDLDLSKEEIQKYLYNIVLLDYNLLEKYDMKELLKLKDEKADIYFIIMTGFSRLDSALNLVGSFAYDYITKPFRLQELDIKIDNIINIHRLNNTINDLTEENLQIKKDNEYLREKINQLNEISEKEKIMLEQDLLGSELEDFSENDEERKEIISEQIRHDNPKVLIYKRNEMLQEILSKIKEITKKD